MEAKGKTKKHTISILILLLSFGDKNFVQNFPHFDDELVSRTVQEFMMLCPMTDLCSLNSTKPMPPGSSGDFVPCCARCLCEDGCRDQCCPDKPDKYLSDEEILDMKINPGIKCVWLQYKTITMKSKVVHTAIEMVVSCPEDYKDELINSKCQRSYHDFDFGEDLTYFVPASYGSEVFKNRYCAICNGADEKDLGFMSIEILCTEDAYFPNFSSMLELKNAIDNDENCDLIFVPNRTLPHEFSICRPLVDRCNVSGYWQDYDADLERACFSYTSVYKFQYKNVHCFLCNKGRGERVADLCQYTDPGYGFNAFTAAVDFRGLQKIKSSPRNQNTACPVDHVYDAVQNTCRHLLCPDLMFVDDGRCTTLYTAKDFIVTDIYITLDPSKDVQDLHVLIGSLDMLREALWYLVTRYLDTKRSAFNVCQIGGFMVLQKDPVIVLKELANSTVKAIKYSDIKYFAFKISLVGRIEVDTTEQQFEIVDGMFMDYKRISELSRYVIRYKSIPDELFNKAEESLRTYTFEGNPAVDGIAATHLLDGALHSKFGAAFRNDVYNLVICPLGQIGQEFCNSNSEHQIHHFCPKLQLSKDEFNDTNNGIYLLNIDNSIHYDNILFTMNDTALVCYKTYMDLVDRYLAVSSSGLEALTPSAIVTVVVLGLSLASLLITFTTYLMLKQLKTLPGLNIMGLTFSLFMNHLLALINIVITIRSGRICIAVGIALHFLLLLSMSWMFVCTFHMAKVFINLQKVSASGARKFHSFTRYILFTIVASAFFVAINMITSIVRSHGESMGYSNERCFIESLDMVLLTSAVPIGIVVVSNIAMFICVIFKVSRSPDMKNCRSNDRNNIAIFAKLSTITGITYVFGFLHQFTEIQIFSYVFVLFNGSQGVFILVAFILNRRVFGMLKDFYRNHPKLCSSDKRMLRSSKSKSESGSYHAGPPHTEKSDTSIHSEQTSF